MNMRLFISKYVLATLILFSSIGMGAKASGEDATLADTVSIGYQMHVKKAYNRWNKIIPTQMIIQNAGNMGIISAGIGWNYGRKERWETNLLLGLIPRNDSKTAKMTITLKENYIPWSVLIYKEVNLEPLTCGIYLNSVLGDEFWGKEPNRYPENYYEYMSTRVRANIFIGQRISVDIPEKKRKSYRSLSFFYEVSTCDLYLRCMLLSNYLKIKDIIGLSFGIKMQIL